MYSSDDQQITRLTATYRDRSIGLLQNSLHFVVLDDVDFAARAFSSFANLTNAVDTFEADRAKDAKRKLSLPVRSPNGDERVSITGCHTTNGQLLTSPRSSNRDLLIDHPAVDAIVDLERRARREHEVANSIVRAVTIWRNRSVRGKAYEDVLAEVEREYAAAIATADRFDSNPESLLAELRCEAAKKESSR